MIINHQAHDLETKSECHMTIVKADGTKEASKKVFLVKEHMVTLYVNETAVAKLVCTPDYLVELCVGRLISEQLISDVNEIEHIYVCSQGNIVKIFLKPNCSFQVEAVLEQTPTCCTGNKMLLQHKNGKALDKLEKVDWKREWVFELARHFAEGSLLHQVTKGGTHSCYLSVKGSVVFAAEDIGRHNALDKVMGYALMQGYCPKDCMIFTSGRVPTDMVEKVIAARFPILVSKAVPTDAAVKLAADHNLVLICRAWPDSYTLYTE